MNRSTLGHLLRPLEKRGLVRLEVSKQDDQGLPHGVLVDSQRASRHANAQRSGRARGAAPGRPRSHVPLGIIDAQGRRIRNGFPAEMLDGPAGVV